jgi:hypothetical protein
MFQQRCSLRSLPLLAILALSTSGCARGLSNPACQPVTAWTPAQQAKVADELQATPADDPIRLFIADYGAMRAGARACLKAAK